jgi:hypothetical protein
MAPAMLLRSRGIRCLALLPDEANRLVSLETAAARRTCRRNLSSGHWCPYCRININAKANQVIPAKAGKRMAIDDLIAALRKEGMISCIYWPRGRSTAR